MLNGQSQLVKLAVQSFSLDFQKFLNWGAIQWHLVQTIAYLHLFPQFDPAVNVILIKYTNDKYSITIENYNYT